jgi:hypothetical protein
VAVRQEGASTIYSASLSRKARLMTYGVGYGVGLGVPLILALSFSFAFGEWFAWIPFLAIAGILAFAALFRPIGYRITYNAVEVLRPVGAKRFDKTEISAVHFPASHPPGFVIGLMRSEGFYGSWGLYWNKRWGRFRVFVTNDENRVEILFGDGRRLILSPDDPAAFVEHLRWRLS